MSRPPRKTRSIRVEDKLWNAAAKTADECGDVLAEVVRASLQDYVAAARRGDAQTWTFFGHWEDELVIDHAVRGEHEDVYPDDGTYEQGLWAASARGATLEEAEANARAEYKPDGD
ncbi:hypothetical protein [Terrabacter sp. C0L_2]|uniref:hypothetical protein n=1 Tax=Terrabacter sp. C0L_2 TaxID=3108389 RepID=UPI002ED471A4|nr:hypothetical protein U5C87_17555 [Terrabacter sp. C0L_2]